MAGAAATDNARPNVTRWRFVVTIFTGSFLLFLVQPLVGRMALPRLGGASAVWTSAMLIYQALLLAGYAYAHWLGRLAPRAQAALQLAMFVLAALLLPIGLISASPSPEANPVLWVPWLLLTSIGPLFFIVSSQAPVIQRWYALSTREDPIRSTPRPTSAASQDCCPTRSSSSHCSRSTGKVGHGPRDTSF
jgi:hypothetical protein